MSNISPFKSLFIKSNINSVDARELHSALGSKRKFTDWIEYYIKDFKKGIDYNIHTKMNAAVNIQTVEYVFTFHMAKHIAMRINTPVGKQVRNYFIECEKIAWKNIGSMDLDHEAVKQQFKEAYKYIKKSTKLSRVLLGYEENMFGELVPVYSDKPIHEEDCSDLQIAEHELRRKTRQVESLTKGLYGEVNKFQALLKKTLELQTA